MALPSGSRLAGKLGADGPAVTVLLPVRNAAATLAAAARSMLRQTLDSLELLIVDDGSDDATQAVIQSLTQDARVRALRQDKLGLAAALNRGLEAARGALIACMDADAVADPERLAKQAGVLARAPRVALIGTGWRVTGPGGAVRRVVLPPESDAGLRTVMAERNALAHPTVMMRRDAVERVGLYRPGFVQAEDFDLWLRLLDRFEAACLPEALLELCEHAAPSSRRGLEQRILSEMGALAAADCRQAGRPDEGDGAAPIDRARLLRMGMTPAEIEAGMTDRALRAAADAEAAAQPQAMREAAALGLRQPALAPGVRGRLALLWARSWRVPAGRR